MKKIVDIVGNQDNLVEEKKVGVKVHYEEAYHLYNQYALCKKFSVQRWNKRRSMVEFIR